MGDLDKAKQLVSVRTGATPPTTAAKAPQTWDRLEGVKEEEEDVFADPPRVRS